MKRFMYLFVLIAVLFSCSENIKDKKMSDLLKEGIEGNDNKKLLSEQLTSEEHELYSKGAKRLLFSESNDFKNMTVGDIIENQRSYDLQKKRAETEKQKQIDKIIKLIGYKVIEKSYYSDTYENYNVFKIEITNKSDKTISGVKTSLYIFDMYEEEIKALTFSYDEPIQAKQTVTYEPMWDCNQFVDEDMEIKNSDIEKLTFKFVPEKILFSDGSKIIIPNNE